MVFKKRGIGVNVYADIVKKEQKKAYLPAFVINFTLSFYLIYALFYFASVGLELFAISPALQQTVLLVDALFCLIACAVWTRSKRSLGTLLVYRTNRVLRNVKDLSEPLHWSSFTSLFSLLLIFMTFALGLILTDFSFYSLFSYEGMSGAKRIFLNLFQPNFSIIGMVLNAMVETIFIAFLATFFAIPLAFILSFFSARNLMKGSVFSQVVYNVLRFISNFTRSIEPLIWAIIFSVWVGIGPFAGMLALMIHSVAALVKLYSEQIESINRGPMEAIEATGANAVQVVWYAVVPQVILPYLSFTIYRWDINIRMATIIGLVGGGGVGSLFMQYQGLAQWNEVGMIVIVIAAVVWLMDYLSAKIREAIY